MSEFETQVKVVLPRPSKIFTPVATTISVGMIVGLALCAYAGEFVGAHLLLGAQTLMQGKVWTLVSYAFINCSVWAVIFDMLLVLLVGSTLEREWGTKNMLIVLLLATLVCAGVWLLVCILAPILTQTQPQPIGTSAPIVYAVVALFGTLMARKRYWFFFVVLEARHIAWILLGLGVIITIGQPLSWLFLLGAAVAWLYVRVQRREVTGVSMFGNRASSSQTGRGGGFVDLE